jgi:hypothetical protein
MTSVLLSGTAGLGSLKTPQKSGWPTVCRARFSKAEREARMEDIEKQILRQLRIRPYTQKQLAAAIDGYETEFRTILTKLVSLGQVTRSTHMGRLFYALTKVVTP